MRVAAISYQVRQSADALAFYRSLGAWIRKAKGAGADLVVLPELLVLELLAPELPLESRDIPRRLEDRAEQYVGLLQALANQFELTIVGGTHIENNRNVCAIVSPSDIVRIEKRILTRWEADEWGLTAGDSQPAAVRAWPIAVAICYDAEFPELVRPLALRGAQVLCVPAYTETQHGHQRVRWSSLARALENQIFVVHAALVGTLGGEPVPSTFGSSAIIAPSIPPFPQNAILAETPLNRAGMAVADLDLDLIEQARHSGDVRNWQDFLGLGPGR